MRLLICNNFKRQAKTLTPSPPLFEPQISTFTPLSLFMLQNPKSALIAFVPRQVTLSSTMKKSSIETLENGVADEPVVVKSSKKDKSKKKKKSVQSPLLQAIAMYLERNGLLKSLEVLKSEASFTKVDNSKVHPLDLEMFYKYLESSKFDKKEDVNCPEGLGLQKDVIVEKNIVVEDLEEIKNALPVESAKKKIKKSKGNDVPETFVDQSETTPETQVNESNKKSKDKKKKKSKSISDENGAEENMDVAPREIDNKKKDSVSKTELDETDVKTKDVKKKKSKSKSESVSEDVEQGTPQNILVENLEKKASKKRKRLTSEETGSQPDDKTLAKEARQSNTETPEEDKKMSQSLKECSFAESEEHTEKKRKTENGEVDTKKSQNISEDGNLEKSGKGGSAQPKSSKKQLNGSAEPKTINAFQRVKVDKVEFADDRLQDNSYWAKDGAEIGYGAKAQEVLGQVRGRDFRHEKTKKKRGSYRGGLIDQESHSIKFNYSDEE